MPKIQPQKPTYNISTLRKERKEGKKTTTTTITTGTLIPPIYNNVWSTNSKIKKDSQRGIVKITSYYLMIELLEVLANLDCWLCHKVVYKKFQEWISHASINVDTFSLNRNLEGLFLAFTTRGIFFFYL